MKRMHYLYALMPGSAYLAQGKQVHSTTYDRKKLSMVEQIYLPVLAATPSSNASQFKTSKMLMQDTEATKRGGVYPKLDSQNKEHISSVSVGPRLMPNRVAAEDRETQRCEVPPVGWRRRRCVPLKGTSIGASMMLHVRHFIFTQARDWNRSRRRALVRTHLTEARCITRSLRSGLMARHRRDHIPFADRTRSSARGQPRGT